MSDKDNHGQESGPHHCDRQKLAHSPVATQADKAVTNTSSRALSFDSSPAPLPEAETSARDSTGTEEEEPCLPPGYLVDDKYAIVKVIGRGGHGTVYEATQTLIERKVALKVLHLQHLNNPSAVEHFKREYTTTAALKHFAIITVYGGGSLPAGQPYLIMDIFEGSSLADFLAKHGRLTLDQFFSVFSPVLSGLGHAHEKGVVHRDLKPSNIMVSCTKDDTFDLVKLVDFGLAKIVSRSTAGNETTITGAVKGTSYYMSPEQCRADAVDQRSDIYALGCVMYESITGKLPFAGDSQFEIMYKHLHDSVSNLSELKSLPDPMARMITGCLKKAPGERYQTVKDLETAFKRCSEQRQNLHLKPKKKTVLLRTALVGVLVPTLCLAINQKLQEKPTTISPPRKSIPHLPRDVNKLLMQVRELRTKGQIREAKSLGQEWLRNRQAPLAEHSRVLTELAISDERLAQLSSPAQAKWLREEAETFARKAKSYAKPDSLEFALAEESRCMRLRPDMNEIDVPQLKKCADLLRNIAPSSDRNLALTELLRKMGQTCYDQSNYVEAEKSFAESAQAAAIFYPAGLPWQYYLDRAAALFRIPNRQEEAKDLMEKVYALVRNEQSPPTRISEMLTICVWCVQAQDLDNAEKYCRLALAQAEKLNLQTLARDCNVQLGITLELKGHKDEARSCFLTAFKGDREATDRVGHFNAIINYARALRDNGDYEECMEMSKSCIAEVTMPDQVWLESNYQLFSGALDLLTTSAMSCEREETIRLYMVNEILPRVKALDAVLAGGIYHQAATLAFKMNKMQQASSEFQEASNLYSRSDCIWAPPLVVHCLWRQADCEQILCHTAKANQLLEEALKFSQDNNLSDCILSSLLSKYSLAISTMDTARAQEALRQLTPGMKGSVRLQIDCLLCLARTKTADNEFAEVDDLIKQALSLAERQHNELYIAHIHNTYGLLLATRDVRQSDVHLQTAINKWEAMDAMTRPWSEMGQACYQLGLNATNIEDALFHIQRATRDLNKAGPKAFSSEYPGYLLTTGVIYLRFGRYKQAEEELKQAALLAKREHLQIDQRVVIMQHLGDTMVLQRKPKDAEVAYQQGIALLSAFPERNTQRMRLAGHIYRTLAENTLTMGNVKAATRYYQLSVGEYEGLATTPKDKLQWALALKGLAACLPPDSPELVQIRSRIENTSEAKP